MGFPRFLLHQLHRSRHAQWQLTSLLRGDCRSRSIHNPESHVGPLYPLIHTEQTTAIDIYCVKEDRMVVMLPLILLLLLVVPASQDRVTDIFSQQDRVMDIFSQQVDNDGSSGELKETQVLKGSGVE